MKVNSIAYKIFSGLAALVLVTTVSVKTSFGQTKSYSSGGLNVNVFVSNPCDGSTTNGFIRFDVVSVNTGAGATAAVLVLVAGPNGTDFPGQTIAVGGSFTYTPVGPQAAGSGEYNFIIRDDRAVGPDNINTFSLPPPQRLYMRDLPVIGLINRVVNDNTSCNSPNGNFIATIDGGSKAPALPFGAQGSFTVTLTSDNGFPVPAPFTTTGNAPINFSNLRGGNFTVTVKDNYSVCSGVFNFVITEPTPTITLVTPNVEVCAGTTTVNLAYSGTTNSPNQYSITFSAAALAQGFVNVTNAVLPASPIVIAVPAAGAPGVYNATLRVTNTSTGCFSDTPITITITAFPTVNAGVDQVICSGSTASLSGTIGGSASSATWTTSGDGTFNNATSLTAIYTPGGADIAAGTVTLTLTTNDPPGACPFVTDNMVITINPAATADAGPDQTVCSDSPNVTLAGSIGGGASSATWSGGAGTFTPNNTTLNATYTPSAGEITAGTVTLTLTTNDPAGPCPAVVDQMTITINVAATVNAGPDQTVCADAPDVILAGTIGGGASSATWSGGAGTFNPNNTTLNATYTPTAGEIAAGTVTLTLTTDDPAGPCGPVNDQMTITINPVATVNAGPDQTVCSDTPTVTLAGSIGGGASSATWSGGAGTFTPNNTTLNATYTPTAGEIAAGTVTLTLTTNDPAGPCGPVNDQMTITIDPAATVNAGPDQTVCADAPDVTLAGTIGGGAASATWSGGAGTFTPNNTTLNATYTPTAGEITAGTVTLTLTTNDPAGPCGPVNDQMTITINPVATADAGPDQTVCSDSPTITLAGVVGGGASTGTWSGGAGTFTPNNTTLNATYTPTAGEIIAGTVTLTLTTNDPAGPCGPVNDQMTITIDPAATVNAGPDQTVCSDSPDVTLAGSIGGGASSATWSGGAGTFTPNNTTLNATYTPTAGEIAAGTVTLTLTTNDPAGPCGAVNDQMTITINPVATVNAGPDQTVCSDAPTVTLAGSIGGGASSATWSGGAGTFTPNNTTLNATYTPTAGEIIAGTVTLTLTTNDPAGPCGPVNDQMTITIDPAATVNAGPDQTVCADAPDVILAGTIGGGASSATWSGGAGTFAPDNTTLNATYTPSAGEITAGTVTLTLTTNDPAGICGPVNDQMTITIDPTATVNAGPDQTVCSDAPTVTLAGNIGGGASSATWSGGAGTFTPNNTTLNATYTPTAGEITAGTVTLTLTTNDPAGPCGPVNDQMIITIDPAATVNAGPDQTVCSDAPTVTHAGNIGGGASSATWSGGAGTFTPNNTTLNATYTPTAGEITAGTVTLTLTTNDPAGPCGAVNDQMTITIDPAATVNAGPDQTVCSDTPTVTLAGSIGGGASSATWSGGAGTFTPNNTTLNATYTPTAGEITAGTVTLTLTTNDPAGPCGVVNDQMTITIDPAATVDAGPDQTVCADAPDVTLAGTIGGGAGSATWSGGAGTFTPNNTTLNATYTPTAGEITAGTVTLTLTTNDPAGPCGPVSDQMIITINPVATADAGPDQTVCSDVPTVTLAGAVGGGASTGTWSGGAGTFTPNNTTLNATYTPTAGEITAGTVTLTLTTNDPAGPCGPDNDQMTITIDPAATVDAGPDQTVCADAPTVTLAGSIGGGASSATWSGGAGTFSPDNTTLNATYTPSAGEITAGTVTLTLTTNDPAGICGPVNDQIIITINPVATADAGPDQTVCSDAPTVTLAGVVGGGASTGTWSGGAGTFTPNNTTLNATYTPTTGEITAGTVTLTLTTEDPAGPCTAAVDQMTITIDPAATVNAGPDQTVCSDAPDVTLAGTISGGATSATWSGGAGTFTPNNTTLNATYTPSAGEITAGTVTLTLTTDDPAGICSAVNDDITITISPVATADAGVDQEICEGSTVTLAGSIGGSASSSVWTTSGDGTFDDDTSLGAIYTPGSGDITAGTVTLTLTTDDPAGACSSVSDNVVITISPQATADAGADQAICAGNTVTLAGVIGGSATASLWTTSGDGTFNDATLLGAVYTPGTNDVTTGTVTLTLTTNDPPGACPAATDNLIVTITAAPTAALSGDNTICQGESTNLTITLTGVPPWNVDYSDGTTTFNLTNILTSPHVFSVTPATTTTYNLVSVTDNCAAGTVSGTATITVQPVAPPADATIAGDATICGGSSTNLTVTITGGASQFTVTIDDGVSPIVINNYSSGAAIPVSPTTTSTYTLTSVVDANGCNALSLLGSATVTVNPAPTSAVLSGSTSICSGGSADILVTITGGTGPYSFTIDNGVGAITNYNSGDPINVNPVVTTTYSITGNVTDANGCSVAGTGTATVTVSSAPTATLTGTASICPGNSTNLTVNLTGVAPWTVVYSDGTSNFTINNISASPLTIPVSPAATTTYNLVSVDDVCGAGTVSGTATVTVRAANDPICTGTGIGCFAYTIVVVDVQTNRPSCSNQNDGRITLDITGTTSGNYIIKLIASAGGTLTQIGPSGIYTFNGLSPDMYEYEVTDASNNVCRQPYNLPIETSVVASASNFVDVACFGTPTGQATFTIISGGNSPYEYSIDGVNYQTFFPGVAVTNLPPNGTYPVLIRDNASDPCPYTVMVTINNVNPPTTIGLTTEDATCGNNDGKIIITTPPAGGTGGPFTYRLDGNAATPTNNTFSNLFGGNHMLGVIDNSGCEQNFNVFVPHPDFIEIAGFNSTDASCNQLGNISILIDNYIPTAQYEVGISNDISQVPTLYFGQYYVGNGLIIISNLSRGNYFIWIRANSTQCPTLLNTIILNDPIVLNGPIPISFDFGCRYANGDLDLKNISGAPGLTYQYEVFGNGFLTTGTFDADPLGEATISGFVSGLYAVKLIQDQSSIGGCPTANTGFINAPVASLDTVFVRVPPPVNKLNLSFPEKGTASRVVRIQESGLGDYEIRLELTQPFGADDPNPVRDWAVVSNQETRFNNLYAGVYTLSLRDGYGCMKDYEVIVEMDRGIWIPNIFTPNNDGFNDTFFIRNLPVSGAKLIVTNRWGKQVFASNNYQNEWEGGNESDGVYYYRLQANGEVHTGWVEIQRGIKP